jgi:hypothetical protein
MLSSAVGRHGERPNAERLSNDSETTTDCRTAPERALAQQLNDIAMEAQPAPVLMRPRGLCKHLKPAGSCTSCVNWLDKTSRQVVPYHL